MFGSVIVLAVGNLPRALYAFASPCNAGHNRQRIRRRYRRLIFRKIAYVFVIQVNVNEGTQLPGIGEEMLLQVGMRLRQLRERFANSSGRYFDRRFLVGILP
jgi:hypothetical protein